MNYQGWEIGVRIGVGYRPDERYQATKGDVKIVADTQASIERLVDRRIREEKLSQDTKLKLGDLIEVHGCVFLVGLEDLSRYRLKSVVVRNGQNVYRFTNPRGKKIMVVHYARNVDAWIQEKTSEDLNKIIVIRETPIWNKG